MSGGECSSAAEERKASTRNENDITSEEDGDILDYGRGGYNRVRIGDIIHSRYHAIKRAGYGHFSSVWLCWDPTERKFVAIKMIRSSSLFSFSALNEIRMLENIHKCDRTDIRHDQFIQSPTFFTTMSDNGSHNCLVYDQVGEDLYRYMISKSKRGFPLKIVKRIIQQVLEGLDYLHTKCKIIHTDIKPENIIISFNKSQIKEIADDAAQSKPEIMNLWASPISCSSKHLPEVEQAEDKRKKYVRLENRKMEQNLLLEKGANSGENVIMTRSKLKKCTANREEISNMEIDEENVKGEQVAQASTSHANSFQQTSSIFQQEFNIKIADLGTACAVGPKYTQKVQTRHYRALEVLMGAEYSTPIDIWSTGCLAFELATGEVLFNPPICDNIITNKIHIAIIAHLIGKIPDIIMNPGTESSTTSGINKRVRISAAKGLFRKLMKVYKWTPQYAKLFTDFLRPMFHYDPNLRATASECLQLPWLLND